MLLLLTGPVRSGKSAHALRLAATSGAPVVLAVAGRADDAEMARRIERHRLERDERVAVIEIEDPRRWLDSVPEDACLVLDCLGTLLARLLFDEADEPGDLVDADAERRASDVEDLLVETLIARRGPTVVVANEVGWGVVPASGAGRLFRDVMGRATRRLADAADGAWLVVAGRCVDIGALECPPAWPSREREAE